MSELFTPSRMHLIGVEEVSFTFGHGASTAYKLVAEGLLPPPVRLGPRRSRWPSSEIAAIQQAYLEGANAAEVKALVAKLVTQRTKGRAM